MAADSLLSMKKKEQSRGIYLPEGNLLIGQKVEVRRLGVGFERSWDLATVTGWRGSLRRVEYDHLSVLVNGECAPLVELVDVSTEVSEDCDIDKEFEHKSCRGLIRPLMPSFYVDEWSLNYGLCVDAYVNNSWCEGVVIDQEVGFDERLIFFPDSGNQQPIRVEQLRITRDWNQGSGCWESRGNWLFLEALEGYSIGSLSGNVCLKQIWHNVGDKKEYHKRLIDWTCRNRARWDSFVQDVIRDMGLPVKLVFNDRDTDRLREITTKRRKTSETQFLRCGGLLGEFDEEIQFTYVESCDEKIFEVGAQNREGREFMVQETIGTAQGIGNNHGCGNDLISVEEEAKEVDSQHDRTIEKGYRNMVNVPSVLLNSNVFQEVMRRFHRLSEWEVENPSKASPQHRRMQFSSVPTTGVLDVSGDDSRFSPQTAILWNEIGLDREKGKQLKQKDTLTDKNHLLDVWWKLWYTQEKKRQELLYTSSNGKTNISLVRAWRACVEEGKFCTDTRLQNGILDGEELKTLGIADKLSPSTSKCSEGDGNNLPSNEQSDKSGPVSPYLPKPSPQANVLGRNQEFQNSYASHPPNSEQTQSQESVDSQSNKEEAVTTDSNATNALVEGHQVNDRIQTSALQSTKRTRRVLRPSQSQRGARCILSSLINNNVVLPEDYVYYRGRHHKKFQWPKGRITHEGIRCDCCQKIFGLSAFEVHACGRDHRPAANIFLEDGRSLADCMKQFVTSNCRC